MRYIHTTIHVRDIEKSIQFYQTVVGLHMVRRFPADGGEIAFLSNGEGETSVELIGTPLAPPYEGKGISIGFETHDVEHEHASAQEKGLKPSDMHQPNAHTRFFYISDPDGVTIQFSQTL